MWHVNLKKSSNFEGLLGLKVMKLRRLLTLIVALLAVLPAAYGASPWEEVDRLPGSPVEQHAEALQDDAFTMVADGYVYIAVRQRTTVKIFTILGQLIVQDTLQPGIYRYKLSTRGIYLLKLGAATRRVTV